MAPGDSPASERRRLAAVLTIAGCADWPWDSMARNGTCGSLALIFQGSAIAMGSAPVLSQLRSAAWGMGSKQQVRSEGAGLVSSTPGARELVRRFRS